MEPRLVQSCSSTCVPKKRSRRKLKLAKSVRLLRSLPPVKRSRPKASPLTIQASPLSLSSKTTPKVTREQSLLIAIKNFRLPTRFPQRFATFSSYRNDKGEEIPLLHRDHVARVLEELDRDVQPVVRRFKVFYSALSEGHPQWSKAAFTNRIPLNLDPNVKTFAHHIQLRVRQRAAPNDLNVFYNRSTLLAVMFHELAHIRHMNHGAEFALLLRDIYRFAYKSGVFKTGEQHQLPSCRAWENVLFTTAGKISDARLLELREASSSN